MAVASILKTIQDIDSSVFEHMALCFIFVYAALFLAQESFTHQITVDITMHCMAQTLV